MKISDVQGKKWAEPTALALKTTGQIITALPPFPGRSILTGAFGLGASILNPDPSLADLRRTEESIKQDIKQHFEEMSSEMKNMLFRLNSIENKIDAVMRMLTDIHYNTGIERIDAAFEIFLEGKQNLENVCQSFNMTELQMTFKQHCNVDKMFTYMKILLEREGRDACELLFEAYLTTAAKYLQLMTICFMFNDEVQRIETLFETFNGNYFKFARMKEGLMKIPEDSEQILARKSIRRTKIKITVNKEQLANIKMMSEDLWIQTFEGDFTKAEGSYNKIFQFLNCHKFDEMDPELKAYLSLSYYHLAKRQPEEAMIYAKKSLSFLTSQTTLALQVDTLRTASRAFAENNEFCKSKVLINKSLAICKSLYGEDHKQYAECLVDQAEYLRLVDALTESKAALTKAIDIFTTVSGKKTLHVADALSDLAYLNYAIQRNNSSYNYEEATQQAEKAIKLYKKLLSKTSIKLVSPKNTLAIILDDQAIRMSGKQQQKTWKKSEELYLFCLQKRVSMLGEFNAATAASYANLGTLYLHMGDNTRAEEMLLKALQIQQAILGPDHSSVASSHNFLGALYDDNLQEYAKAEEHYLECIRISTALFGPGHSELQYDYNGLIMLYEETGEEGKKAEYEKKRDEWEEMQTRVKPKEDVGDEILKKLDTIKEIVEYVIAS